jgi:DNA recombination protein RmuC
MREQAHVIQREVQTMMGDVGLLDKRVTNLQRHFDLASRDVGEIHTSAQKITKRGERIEEIEVGDGGPEAGPAEELATPKPRVISTSGK